MPPTPSELVRTVGNPVGLIFLALVGGAALVLLSCGVKRPLGPGPAAHRLEGLRPEGELEVRQGTRSQPSLRATLPYANPAARLGYGGIQLWAGPERDELRLSAIIDAPAKETRWVGCTQVELWVDGELVSISARYVGGPMEGGVYDAVQLELGIEQLRRLARARRARGAVCGDPLEIGASQRATLADFVDWFDRLAMPAGEGKVPAYREIGPVLERLPREEVDPGPHPA